MDFILSWVEKELMRAIRSNIDAVNKLLKYERRQWISRLPAQQAIVKATRHRVFAAWDALRSASQQKEDEL